MNAFRYLTALAVFSILQTAVAERGPDDHSHIALTRNETLTYTKVFEQAFKNAPEAISAQSRQQQTNAYQQFGKGWTSGTTKALFNYLDDKSFDNVGLQELEAGIEWQLWFPGGKRNIQRLGKFYQEETDAWQNHLKLMVAGQMRTVLADIRQGEALVSQAYQNKAAAQQLLDVAKHQLTAGEIPQSAVMQARSLRLEEDKNLLTAEAALIDAKRMYASLTGLQEYPITEYKEAPSSIEDITTSHPLLHFLQASIDVTNAKILLAKHEARGSPTLSLGMRRQRGDRFEDYTDSLAVSFSIPIGGSSYISTKVSDASRVKADAEVTYQMAYRHLKQKLHEIRHELAMAHQAIELGKTQVSLNKQQAEMAQQAFELGETSIDQVIRVIKKHQSTQADYQLLLLKKQRLVSELNQTVGILP